MLAQYNHGISDLVTQATQGAVFFVDLFSVFTNRHLSLKGMYPDISLWTDGVHLSQLGHQLAAETILEAFFKVPLSSVCMT